ncbi:MAG: hypothetical protein LBL74_04660 [Bacteroidales bacterium]|jgi:hypothetical protein|nr:hypothetical protein [Bacteroidales bacterium]
MKYIVSIFRLIFGAVFMFSGFVKAIDPYGTAFKMEEYINVFGMSGLFENFPSIYIITSVIMCSIEFMIGFMMFFHLYRKAADWMAAIIMLFFTTLTLIDALTNKVSDCGCFGDFIKLTNWETFWKNIVLDVILLVILIFTTNRHNRLYRWQSLLLMLVGIVLVVGFCIRNILYEPIVDFRAWKVGNQIILPKNKQKPMVSYATYRNNETNKVEVFPMDELQQAYESDTAFAQHWTWIASEVKNPNTISASGFAMMDLVSQSDHAYDFMMQDDTVLIVPCVDLSKPNEQSVKRVLKYVASKGKPVAIITASGSGKWDNFITKYNIPEIPLYSTDDKAIEAMVRSSIAVVEMYDGKVISKKSWRSLPK